MYFKFLDNAEFDEALNIFEKIERMAEFHPTNSVIGSIIAQEAQKIVTRSERPFYGLFTYDIKTQMAKVYEPNFQDDLY